MSYGFFQYEKFSEIILGQKWTKKLRILRKIATIVLMLSKIRQNQLYHLGKPWIRVNCDFLGPFQNKYFIVIVIVQLQNG